MELWDAYDAGFQKIPGRTLIRGEEIPDGLYHLVGEVLVRHVDGTILLMRRDRRKHFGGLWEATAGGSAFKGETPLICARRELKEETGIDCDSLQFIGTNMGENTIYKEFLCLTDIEKHRISLQEGETIAFRWVTPRTLLSMGEDELVTTRMQQYVKKML